MQYRTVIWLPQKTYDRICNEATKHFPLETGGAFMGYWADDRHVVITSSIHAGPNAIHNRYSFEPDYLWQRKQVALHYIKSGREETYLGDWHTHPNGFSGKLSREDKNDLRRIAAYQAARTPNPISLVFYGDPEEWAVNCWCAAIVRRKFMWPRLNSWAAELRTY